MGRHERYKDTLESKVEYANSLGYRLNEEDNFGVDSKVNLTHPTGYDFYVRWDHFTRGLSRGDGRSKPSTMVPYKLVKDMYEASGYELVTKEEDYRGVTRKVTSISPNGYEYVNTPEKFKIGRRHPKEGKVSYGEHLIYHTLRETLKKGYRLEDEYFTKIKGVTRFYDFAIVNAKTNEVLAFIEYHGRQHYESVPFWGGEGALTRQIRGDKDKREYCNNNNIPYLEIPYTSTTREVLLKLQKKLGRYIKSTDILSIHTKAFTEIVSKGRPVIKEQEVIEYYKTHTIKETLREFNISKTTLFRYTRRVGYRK